MKTIYRITPNNRLNIIEAIRTAPDYQIVEIRPEDRTAAQNRFYWATLRQISESIAPQGRTYNADVWHEYCKTRWLSTMMIELPNGEIKEVERTTTNLTKHEFSDYITQVLAWCGEMGMLWSDDMVHNFNDTEFSK